MSSRELQEQIKLQFPDQPIMRILRAVALPLPPREMPPALDPCENPNRRHRALAENPLDLSLIGLEIPGWSRMIERLQADDETLRDLMPNTSFSQRWDSIQELIDEARQELVRRGE